VQEADGMNEAMRPLAGTHFAVFGLGNTTYEHFNKSSKVLDAQLEQCGGIRVMKIGLGNDDEDIEEDYQKWIEQVTTVIADKGYASKGGDRTSIGGDGPAPPPAAYTVEVQNGNVKPYPLVIQIPNPGHQNTRKRPLFHQVVMINMLIPVNLIVLYI
jgi:sulfite reductase alpha subunit-like flavoprotein